MSIENFTTVSIVYLIVGIIITIGMIFYIIPHLDVWLQTKKEEAEKKRKRQLMNKIVLQKNLEDVIAKELERGKT